MINCNFEYVGNLHIHSSYSDGTGKIPEIAGSARKVGLDFIVLNDHDHMTQSLHLDEEGFYDGMLVLMGLEIGGRYHHYLAYDLKEMIKGHDLEPQQVIDRVNGQGGFGYLAHPFEKGMPFMERSVAYTWNDISVKGFTGICIWNFSSRWKERIKSPLHGILFLASKTHTLRGPTGETLSFWDELCRKDRVVGIGGSDAHGAAFRWGVLGFTPLSYDYLLNSINVHLLLEKRLQKELNEARFQVYGALRRGHLFIAHENLAPARGFRFDYLAENGPRLSMGDEDAFRPGVFHIKTPGKSEIRLVRNGRQIEKWHAQSVSFRAGKSGVYRVEVYRRAGLFGWRPWIYSNPIYLRKPPRVFESEKYGRTAADARKLPPTSPGEGEG